MELKSPGHSTYFGVVDKFHLFRINAPIYVNYDIVDERYKKQDSHLQIFERIGCTSSLSEHLPSEILE